MTVATLPTPARTLNRFNDRCDRCGVEGFILATKGESELVFCGHHGVKNLDALVEQGWDITDYRENINKQPSISANKE